MASNRKKWYRINPKLWSIDAATVDDFTLTHKPQELSPAVAKKVIGSLGYRKGIIVMVECEAPPPPPPPPVLDDETEEETTTPTTDE